MAELTITFTPILSEEAFVVVRFIARRVKNFLILNIIVYRNP